MIKGKMINWQHMLEKGYQGNFFVVDKTKSDTLAVFAKEKGARRK
jgi:hypothetical protein